MKLENYLKQVILENSRFNVLLDKYVKPTVKDGKKTEPAMDLDTYYKIILSDPTTRIPEGFDQNNKSLENYSKLKLGSYTNWLIRNFVNPELSSEAKDYEVGTRAYNSEVDKAKRLFIEDLFKLTSELKDFDKYKKYMDESKRNIDNYTPSQFLNMMYSFEVPQKLKSQEEKTELKKQRTGFEHPGGKVEFVGPNWTVIKISDTGEAGKDAAFWYGGFRDYKNGETNWCTAEPNPSHNMFSSYIKKGPLYVVIPNNTSGGVGERTGLPTNRYQFHFPDNMFMDRLDKSIDLVKFLMGEGEELKEYFKPEFAKGLTSVNGKKVEIDYPNGAIAKFVGLYGFDELFNSLPKDITQFLFNNRGDTNLKLTIPDTIGQFTQLESILLQNCINKLPDSIGNLKSLIFVSLLDNKDLKELPDSLIELPNLKWLFLKNTGVKVTPKFLSKFDEVMPGGGMYQRKK